MAATKVELGGARELIETFQKLNGIVATVYINESLQAGAEVGLEAIIRKAPTREGTLKSAIKLVTNLVTRNRVEKTVVIKKEGFYWRFLEFGTSRMPPHAFIRQAFKNRKSTVRQTIRDTFRDRVLGFRD